MTGQHRDLKTLTELLKQAAREARGPVEVEKTETIEKAEQAEAGAGAKASRLKDMGSKLAHQAATAFDKTTNEIGIVAAKTPLVETTISVGGDARDETPPEPPEELLKESIREAIRLEFATVPPYLIALWSIIDQAHPVAKSIRAIAHEEMLHVAILCNLLSALGERPNLTGDMIPQYPGRLPGKVHPELEVRLLAYGKEALDIFLEIERPEEAVEIIGEPPDTFPSEDETIGAFYDALLELYDGLLPDLDPSHQVAGPFSWFVMSDPKDVREAITLIKSQGEGASGLPFNRDPRFLSHYYRFKSMALSVELEWVPEQKKLKKGAAIAQPSVFTLAAASPKGYGLAVPRELREANERFVASFSSMLRLLEESWKDGGHKSFVAALEHMFELTELAQTMMRISTPDGRGYCPAFIYRP